MFAALKGGEGMIDMWMQSVETFHRWLSIVQIGRALIQMLAVKGYGNDSDTKGTLLNPTSRYPFILRKIIFHNFETAKAAL